MQTSNRASDEQVLGLLVGLIPVLPFDEAASVTYGLLCAAIRDRRRDALNRLIAAHALSVNATPVTNNGTNFKDYPGLIVANWA